MKKHKTEEQDNQIAFINYLKTKHKKLWDDMAIHSIPNESNRGPRATSILKRAGLVPGVADLAIDIGCGGYFGLKIEMKSKIGKPTDNQKKYLERSSARNYKTAVCHSWIEAKDVFEEYIALGPTKILRE